MILGLLANRVRHSLAGLSLAPASCYSAGGAGARGVRKCGFFGLLVHFVKREKWLSATVVS
jgi:hypothetical protein